MKGKRQLNDQERQAYLDGLKRYHQKGIPIYIDDEEMKETEWGKFLRYRMTEVFI